MFRCEMSKDRIQAFSRRAVGVYLARAQGTVTRNQPPEPLLGDVLTSKIPALSNLSSLSPSKFSYHSKPFLDSVDRTSSFSYFEGGDWHTKTNTT